VLVSAIDCQALQVCPETLDFLKNKGVPGARAADEAVLLYNELAEKQPLGEGHAPQARRNRSDRGPSAQADDAAD
jgi:hypothetical protein